MKQVEIIQQAADQLANVRPAAPVLVGFDGFVDTIIHVVDERTAHDAFRPMAEMTVLADRVRAAAGKSCNIELVPQMVKLGGNGPILANSLSGLGYKITYMGALGRGAIHPVFQDFAASCAKVVSLCDPAFTDALEFHDGKVMLGKMGSLSEVNWVNLLAHVPEEAFRNLLKQMAMVACVNWTMLPFMNGIFKGITSVLQRLDHAIPVFVDLTDPRKRTQADLLEALSLLSAMQGPAKVILGLNELESEQVAQALDVVTARDLEYRADAICAKLGLEMVVIHPRDSAYVAHGGESFHVHGPFTAQPKLTTGAGDVFNSGFCHGILSGLSPHASLAAGVCASGFYVRNCRSAHAMELVDFMNRWASAGCGEI